MEETWEATAETVTQGDNEQYFIYNLVPNHIGIRSSMASSLNLAPGINLPVDKGVKLSFLYQVDGNVSISAQRVAKSDENSIWFCNFTDVAQQGAGGLMLELDRHGVPVLPDDVEIGWCAMQPSAYMVSEKKMISRLAVYRNRPSLAIEHHIFHVLCMPLPVLDNVSKMVDGPLHHWTARIHERMGAGSEGVVGVWRHFGIDLAHEKAVGLKVSQCRRQHLL